MRLRLIFRSLLLVLISAAAFGQSREDSLRLWNARLALATPEQWAERARLLETWLREDPAAALAAALPPATADRLRRERPDAAQWLEEWGEWEGPAEVLIHDDFGAAASRRIVSLRLPQGDAEVYVAGDDPQLQCGDSLRVKGLRLNSRIAAQSASVSQRGASTPCSTTGDQKVAIILLNFPGNPLPASINATAMQANLNGTSNSVNGYWSEASYGRASASGSVFGPFTLSQSYACSATSAIRTAAIAAADSTVDFSAYNRIVLIFPGNCGGLGTVGCTANTSPSKGTFQASFAWIGADFASSSGLATCAMVHELGHGLGLEHASSAAYGTEPLGGLGATATHDEYGDRYSLMGLCYGTGSIYLMGHYAAPQKQTLGWFAASNFQQVETAGTFTLAPFEQTTTSPQALRIRRGSGNDRWVWVEYRQPIGYDSTLSSYSTQALTGALLHYDNPAEPTYNGYTRLLNMKAATNPGSFTQPALTPGQTWTDPYTNLSLRVTSAGAAGLALTVNYDTPCASVSPASNTHPSTAATGSINVTAAAGCSWVTLSNDSWITISSGASGSGNGTVNYSLTANTAANPRNGTISVGRQTFSVTQNSSNSLPTPTSISPGSGAVAVNTNQLFTAIFTDADGANTLNVLGVWITPDTTQNAACYVEYRRATAELRLYDDSAFSWSYSTIGTNTTLSNSQCQIALGSSSAVISGSTLTLRLTIKFLTSFLGARNIYGQATDTAGGDSGPRSLGAISVSAAPVAITFSSVPAGYQVSVGGSLYTTPATINLSPGSTVALDVPSPQAAGASRAAFATWSDGGAKAHSLTVPSTATTYTATFTMQHPVTTAVSPAGAGTITISPASSDGFYNAGTVLQFTAAPVAGYAFTNFTGALTGTANPQNLTLSGPVTINGIFGCGYVPAINTATVSPVAGSGSFTVTAGTGCAISPVSNAAWLTASAAGSTVNYSYQSNLSNASRSATLTFGGQTVTVTQTAGLTTPATGATLGTSQTFSWASSASANSYWLDVGSAVGSGNLCASGQITTTTFSCNNLPASSTVYVQLFLRLGTAWSAPLRYTYTTAAPGSTGITTPAPGSRLTASSTFAWVANGAADAYWLDIGTTVGLGDICASGVLAAATTTYTCNAIPSAGANVYVQLWTRVAGVWGAPQRYTYLPPVASAPVAATLTAPAPASTLAGSSVTFTWTTGSGIDQYWLDVGSTVGLGDLSAGLVTTTSKVVNGLPADGRTIYARLWSHQAGGNWLAPFDYSFTAGGGDPRATLLVPGTGGTLSGNSLPFGWKAGTGADGYWLDVGPTQGSGAYSSGFTTTRGRLVSTLPCSGQTVWVRLWTRVAGVYQAPLDYSFTAATGCPATDPRATLATPALGSTLLSSSATFTWNAGGAGVTQYWLDVGTSLGSGNLSAGAATTLTRTVSGLPANGQPIYVRLWTNIGGVWQPPIDYVF